MEWRSKGFFCHDVIEILSWNLSAIRCGTLKHFFELLDVHGFAQLLSYSTDVIGVDGTSVVIVEEIENFVDAVLNY